MKCCLCVFFTLQPNNRYKVIRHATIYFTYSRLLWCLASINSRSANQCHITSVLFAKANLTYQLTTTRGQVVYLCQYSFHPCSDQRSRKWSCIILEISLQTSRYCNFPNAFPSLSPVFLELASENIYLEMAHWSTYRPFPLNHRRNWTPYHTWPYAEGRNSTNHLKAPWTDLNTQGFVPLMNQSKTDWETNKETERWTVRSSELLVQIGWFAVSLSAVLWGHQATSQGYKIWVGKRILIMIISPQKTKSSNF